MTYIVEGGHYSSTRF